MRFITLRLILLALVAGSVICAATVFVAYLPEKSLAFEFFRNQVVAIDPPPETTLVETAEYSRPDVDLARLTVRYQSNYRTSSMLDYYAERLPTEGWIQTPTDKNDATVLAQYCQDPYALKIRSSNAYYTLEYSRGIDWECAGGKLGVASSLLILAWSLPMSILGIFGAFIALRDPEAFAAFGRDRHSSPRLFVIVVLSAIGVVSAFAAFVGIRSLWGNLIG